MGAYENASHLWPFASLYRNLGSPGEVAAVKAMPLWAAGAVLGQGFPDSDAPAGEVSDVVRRNAEYHAAVARGETPEPPRPTPPDRSTVERQANALRAVG